MTIKSTHNPQWKDKGTYKEPTDSDNVRVPRLEVDDATTYVDKDGSDNLTLTDAVTGTKTLAELAAGAAGDVTATANITDHSIVRGDGGVKGVQDSGVIIDDSDNVEVGTYGVKLNPTNKEIQFGTGSAWNVRLKYGANDYVYVWNAADNYYAHFTCYTLRPIDILMLADAHYISAPWANDNYTIFKAYYNNNTHVEIARLQGAADPYFSMGGSQEFKFYNSGYGTLAGNFHILSQNELRFYDNGNYVGFEAPALSADQIWVLPTADGNANEVLQTNGSGTLGWAALAGGGDVTGPASSTDNEIARQHSTTGKVLQTYTSNPPTISDTGDMNIDGDLDVENIVVSGNVDGKDVSGLATAAEAVTAVEAAGIALAEDKLILLDTLLSDDEHWSGIAEIGTMGYGTTTVGDLIYLDGVSSNDKWELAKADTATTSKGKLGICLEAVAEDATCNVLLYGKMRSAAFPDPFTVGAPVHISAATAGDMAVAAPTGTTNFVVRIIGYGNTAEDLFFCPDNSYVELA